ncbi:hypothetical protein FPOAC2_04418 [Fusarium poae]|jgi:hypothetical protein
MPHPQPLLCRDDGFSGYGKFGGCKSGATDSQASGGFFLLEPQTRNIITRLHNADFEYNINIRNAEVALGEQLTDASRANINNCEWIEAASCCCW